MGTTIERSHVPTRDRLRGARGLKSVATGQRFLEGFEGLHALRRGHVKLRALVPRLSAHEGLTARDHTSCDNSYQYVRDPTEEGSLKEILLQGPVCFHMSLF
jgi:hypothetical protein